MPLNIKNIAVEKLVQEISKLTGESKTETIRKALLERKSKLSFQLIKSDKKSSLENFLAGEIWAAIPKKLMGKKISKKREEEILGFKKEGV